jgi:hypothetical protein
MMLICYGLKDEQNCTSTALIKAHIIPQGFARFIRGDGHNYLITANKKVKARYQLGVTDKTILCYDCDQVLGVYDKYAMETCKKFQSLARSQNGEWTMPNVDGDKFAKFILSVLWRASISKDPTFATVALGQYESKAREVLYGVSPLSSFPEFEVLLRRYKSNLMSEDKFLQVLAISSIKGSRFTVSVLAVSKLSQN